MTTTTNQPKSASIGSRLQNSQPARYLILGLVLIAVSVLNLTTVVQTWAWSFSLVTDHPAQFVGIAAGAVLAVVGIVKSRRS